MLQSLVGVDFRVAREGSEMNVYGRATHSRVPDCGVYIKLVKYSTNKLRIVAVNRLKSGNKFNFSSLGCREPSETVRAWVIFDSLREK